ncbi:MAG: MFS transporter [Actinomycetales bacterium]|nr:MFS transporter [Actinomycetales bacterium]
MTPAATQSLARLDRLPRWPWSRGLLVNLGGSFFFAFFDIVVIGAALPIIIKQFGVSAQMGGWAITAGLVGLIIGSFIGAWLASHKTRVFALQSALWCFSLGMLLSVFAPELAWLIVARFIAGLGTGADLAIAVTYVAEISPQRARGRITGFTTICGYVGIAIVPFLGFFLVDLVSWGWRILFAFGALGAVLIVLTRRHMPPSPRLLAERGEDEQLQALVAQAEDRVRARIGELPPVAPPTPSGIVRRPAIWVISIFTIAWVFYYFGNYGWLTVAPTLFTQNGFAITESLGYIAFANCGLVVGAVASYFLAERVERKWLLIGTLVVWAIALMSIGVIGTSSAIAVLGFVASFTIGLTIPIFYAFTSEHFPSHTRPWGMAWTDGLGHAGGAIAPYILIGLALPGAFGAMALSGVAAAVMILFTTRTRGRSLEELTGG